MQSKIFIDSFKQKGDGLSSGHEGRPGEDLAVGDVVARVVAALSATAPLPRGQVPQRMLEGARWDWDEVEDSVMVFGAIFENIYTFFRLNLSGSTQIFHHFSATQDRLCKNAKEILSSF